MSIGGEPEAAIGKRNDEAENKWIVFNEIICYRLASVLGLPIPDGFVHRPPGEPPFFVQLNFRKGRNRPPPINAAEVVKDFPLLSARIVVFDALVINTDRHAGNLARLSMSGGPDELYVYDHSHCILGGRSHSPGLGRLSDLDRLGCGGALGNRHCLLSHLKSATDVEAASEKVASLTDEEIENAVLEARAAGMVEPEAGQVEEALKYRRDHIHEIIEENRSGFDGISQWTFPTGSEET